MASRRANGGQEPAEVLVDQNTAYDTSREIKVQNTFDKILKNPEVLRGAFNFGFEKPSAIQQRAIAPIIAGRDLIAQAQSGTGKTTMIALATCEKVDIRVNECAPAARALANRATLDRLGLRAAGRKLQVPALCACLPTALAPGWPQTVVCRPQVLILSPTRELAQQTERATQAIGEFIKIRTHCCIGGTSLGAPRQLGALQQPRVWTQQQGP